MGQSLDSLYQDVILELGGTKKDSSTTIDNSASLEIELTKDQFDTVVRRAKKWFIAKKGFSVFRPVPIVPGQSEYFMKEDVAQVLDVIFEVPNDVSAFFSLGFFDLIPYGPQSIGSIGAGLANYSGFAQLLEYTEKRKRVFSVDPDWYYDQQNRKLIIATRPGSTVNAMLVHAKLSEFNPKDLHDKDDYIFTSWVKAKCKEVVGRIRSKYDSLPAASGSVTLDGKDLIAEAKEELEKLEIEIFSSQGPDVPIMG
jgi:hypothetical protein